MAFWILPNTAGAVASSMSVTGSTTTSGYDVHDLISGPRSRMWRRDSTATTGRVAYVLPSSQTLTHCVIARGDLLLTEAGTALIVEYDNGSAQTIENFGTVATSDLVGIKVDGKPHGQDIVCSFPSPIAADQFQFAFDSVSGGGEAAMFSKLYFSAGLLLGDGPQPGPTWSVRRDGEPAIVKPLLGYEEYAVTDAIAFRWANLSWEEIEAFEAAPLNWPVFLFDSAGDIFAHKLEHALLTSYSWSRVGAESFALDTVWNRLNHHP